jgi:hypothetical protein
MLTRSTGATTGNAVHFTVPVFLLVLGWPRSPPLFVAEHRRPLVCELLFIKKFAIRRIMIRWRYPFPWYDARESDADAGGAVEPAGGWPTCEFFA